MGELHTESGEALTDKQILFIEKYFELGMNGTRAAVAAGYSKKTARQIASQNLSKLNIRTEIERRMAELAMSSSEVLARLADHARGDMRDFIGKPERSLVNHPNGNLIKKYEKTITKLEDGSTETRIKLELYDAQAALVHLGKHLRLFDAKVDITSGGAPVSVIFQQIPARTDEDTDHS